ncbi:MAG: hypothetical protein V8T33_15780 [Parabacteroides distasonis]
MDAAQEDYLKTKTIFHYQNKNTAEEKCIQLQYDIKSINHKKTPIPFCVYFQQKLRSNGKKRKVFSR